MKNYLQPILATLALLASLHQAAAQGTAFTYQGKLNDGVNPAAGTYDLRFTIYDSTNNPGVVVAGPLTNSATGVTNGLFAVTLDFGTGVFTGPDRWLEIGVCTNVGGGGTFATLSPRQQLTPAPYTVYAMEAGVAASASASNLVGTLLDSSLSTNVAMLNSNAAFAGTVTAGAFSGSGTGITNILLSGLGSGGGVNGQVLAYNGEVWVPANSSHPAAVILSIDGTNVSVNAVLGTTFRLTCTTNVLIQNPSGGVDGQRIIFELVQDEVGGRKATWDSNFAFGIDLGQPDVVLTPTPGKRDFVGCLYNAAVDRWFVISFVRGY